MIDEYTLYVHTEEKKVKVFKRLVNGSFEKITIKELKKVLDEFTV